MQCKKRHNHHCIKDWRSYLSIKIFTKHFYYGISLFKPQLLKEGEIFMNALQSLGNEILIKVTVSQSFPCYQKCPTNRCEYLIYIITSFSKQSCFLFKIILAPFRQSLEIVTCAAEETLEVCIRQIDLSFVRVHSWRKLTRGFIK